MSKSILNAATRLRHALKSAGLTARQVTVRYALRTLHVTVHDASVSLIRVRAIASAFESTSRDHATGEILCGGNTFVSVEYADAQIDPLKASILTALRAMSILHETARRDAGPAGQQSPPT